MANSRFDKHGAGAQSVQTGAGRQYNIENVYTCKFRAEDGENIPPGLLTYHHWVQRALSA